VVDLHGLAVEAGVVDIETFRIGGPQFLRRGRGTLGHHAHQHVLMGDHLGALAPKGSLLRRFLAGDDLAAGFTNDRVAADMVGTPVGVHHLADRLLTASVFLGESLDLREQLRRHRLGARIDDEHALVADMHRHVRLAWLACHEPDLSSHLLGMNLPIFARRRIGISVGSVNVHWFAHSRLWRLRRRLGR
jgi:hypothetical protein